MLERLGDARVVRAVLGLPYVERLLERRLRVREAVALRVQRPEPEVRVRDLLAVLAVLADVYLTAYEIYTLKINISYML